MEKEPELRRSTRLAKSKVLYPSSEEHRSNPQDDDAPPPSHDPPQQSSSEESFSDALDEDSERAVTRLVRKCHLKERTRKIVRASGKDERITCKLQPPPVFNGKGLLSVEEFLDKVFLHFEMFPTQFVRTHQKVAFIISFLSESPSRWAFGFLKQCPDAWEDHEMFIVELIEQYGDTERKTVAAQKIRELKQNQRPMHLFVSEF